MLNKWYFTAPSRLTRRHPRLNSRKKIFDLDSEIKIWYSTLKNINIFPQNFFLIFFSFWDIGLWKYSLVGFLWGPATPQNFYCKIEFYSRNHQKNPWVIFFNTILFSRYRALKIVWVYFLWGTATPIWYCLPINLQL